MATEFEKIKGGYVVGGAALKRMQEIAQQIYDSTPGIQEELPRNVSKILQNVKKEDNKAEKRAQFFLNEGAPVRKGGTVDKKDITVAMTAEDWETKYKEIWEKFLEEKKRTEVLKDRLISKQERYIQREQEYRKTIEMIEKDIEQHSTKPLKIILEQDENQLLLSGIDPNMSEQQELMEKEKKMKLRNEIHIPQKNVKEIHSYYEKIMETITNIQENTAKELWKQRSEIWTALDKKLEDIKMQLKAETEKKKENQYDFKEKEKELNEHLETMTQIAQKIDDENRNLMKKNSELKIQYLSQENDRDLLLKQLIFQKKESQRLKKLVEDVKRHAETLKTVEGDENQTKNDQQSRTQLQSRDGGKRIPSGIPRSKMNPNNVSGLNNSRRNISLGSAAVMMIGSNRPKTAAIGGGGLPRPPTAIFQNTLGKKISQVGMSTGNNEAFNFQGFNRAVSAQIVNNPRVKRYEDLINRLKKMLIIEKKSLRMVRTMLSREIEIKNFLEKILRQCADDVKGEISKKRSENKTIYYSKGKKGQGELMDEKNLTQQEREKIIEVLLSQERVLTLLYDKTFPPRPSTGQIGLKGAFANQTASNFADNNQMRQFNYYGQMPAGSDEINEGEIGEEEEDVQKLEQEIEEVLRNRRIGLDQNDKPSHESINIRGSRGMGGNSGVQDRGKSANPHSGKRNNLMSAAYKNSRGTNGGGGQIEGTAEIGENDIYEDEESSGNEDL